MTDNRTMSVKRGLTRLKTIEAQLGGILEKISAYGAVSSKAKSFLVDTKVDRTTNHELARQEVKSLYQQHRDLLEEYSRIKTAINISNLTTHIEVAGKRMTLAEALLLEKDTRFKMEQLAQAFRQAVLRAERAVESYNAKLSKDGMTAEEMEMAMAQVEYMVEPGEINKTIAFLNEFITEVNGIIDESNVLTIIEID